MVSPRWYIVLLAVPLLFAVVFAQSPNPPLKPLTAEQRGDILMARKMYREAVEMYAEEKPVTAVVRNKTGIAYHQMLQFEVARKYYEMAVKLDHNYAEAMNNLGTVYFTRKNYRRAISQYKKALHVAPQTGSFYVNLGIAYFKRKNYKEAAESFQQAVTIDPEVFEHRGSFGVILQEQTVSGEERAKFHYSLAKTYAKSGQIQRALQYIRKALEEGFNERKKIMDEPAFVALREMPEFKELVTSEPRVL